jgi:dipeptidyl aminopeptidase/acylaminoacyl peptidase
MPQPLSRFALLALLLFFYFVPAQAQDNTTYKMPPKEMADLLLAKPTPSVSVSSNGEWMLLQERSTYTTVEELAQPELRIAGLRINPNNFGPSRAGYASALQLKNIKTGQVSDIEGLPAPLRAVYVLWSPNETKIAFANNSNNRIDLYIIDVLTKKAIMVNSKPLNAVMGTPFEWAGDDALVYLTSANSNKPVPEKPAAPSGPVIQENKGKAAGARTFQDLIKSAYDETLFEFYATAELQRYDNTGNKAIGSAAIYSDINVSPDKNFILTRKLQKPFSYLVPASGFPSVVTIQNMNGAIIKQLASLPSAEGAPIGFDDVVTFARGFNWRSDEPATVYYVQALDKGLGRSKAEFRDGVYLLPAPFTGEAKELVKTKRRFAGIAWGNATTAIINERLFADRRQRMSLLNPSTGAVDSLFERRSDDAYADIGSPMMTQNSYGRNVLLLLKNNTQLLLRSQGASPDGDLPFIQSFDLKTKKANMLWRCEAPYYENVIDVLNAEKMQLLTLRESEKETPNYFIRDLKNKKLTAITQFADPYPALRAMKKEKISYKRSDGVDLTATLYLPAGYDPQRDGRLPVLIWAYPREYKSAADAAQVRGSKYTFTRINWASPVFWATQGYAVMDNAEMPIVGEDKKEPNDNFVEQLQMNAEAAIKKIWDMGVGDSARVAVGGHSYGAFMTANLLAHTKLFKAGIARSGAYNRTLTPFGFQSEERTYWQAPELYNRMSPFSYADKIKTPLLLVHGDADNNSGTFPIQSERLYNAVKGHGGAVRFVLLPYESHSYAAKENLLHMLWEQNQWLEQYVKGAKRGF